MQDFINSLDFSDPITLVIIALVIIVGVSVVGAITRSLKCVFRLIVGIVVLALIIAIVATVLGSGT